ncbi:type I-C CRISPR-associated protein Cas8c/Csd1 [Govanella unica]|uniref:Type I-C CRISPR-associated protein Cas8c/Csd1 n=1 Tax=Govanella unica TaxID=2975056 RepID=A0A9X3Z805_9PROT|nr:type I-C CRISPR-associated protein Cas8c/Csd1 [Govania unica]MDA5194524.1 type I-C CRISPR-associated protein Cas8c/Csd1 [Govania unica]
MTILQALDGYYQRLSQRGEVSAAGWSPEKFGWCIILGKNGEPIDVQNLHDMSDKKPKSKLYRVPASFPRPGVTPRAFFLWDKTAFSLGVTKPESGTGWQHADKQHEAFRTLHFARLAGQNDEGLVALHLFLEKWRPERFDEAPFGPDMLDANIMFRLDGELNYLHERPAARALVDRGPNEETKGEDVFCLITGERGAVARLHPTIKNVEGAQSSGAALVSFNLDAFTSLGKGQGDNAPTSEAAAFRYGAALNQMLIRGGPNRVRRPIGDATVVFWADASKSTVAEAADSFFADAMDPDTLEDAARYELAGLMAAVAKGRTLASLRPDIAEGTRFHVLGLSPNAARLSVRYWMSDDIELFAGRLARHYADMTILPEPLGWGGAPSVNRLLARSTALQEKYENIPPVLAGEVMRAILSGGCYPRSLLAAAVIRLRAGDDPLSGWHVAVIRAVLSRDHHKGLLQEDVPMSLAPDEPNKAYQLGRLFAVLETAQRMALGKLNATIRDRYFGAASATPARVFPLLLRGVQNHLGKLRKDGKGGWIEREIENILDKLSLDLPRALPLTEQGRFAIGYYHQRKEQFKGRPAEAAALDASETSEEGTEE